MAEEPRIELEFRLVDEFGNEFGAISNVEVFESLGEKSLEVIGRQFNTFLKQVGYPRKRDNIMMDDLTDDELDALCDYLYDMREKDNNYFNGGKNMNRNFDDKEISIQLTTEECDALIEFFEIYIIDEINTSQGGLEDVLYYSTLFSAYKEMKRKQVAYRMKRDGSDEN